MTDLYHFANNHPVATVLLVLVAYGIICAVLGR